MKNMFLLISHKLSEAQIADAKQKLGVENFVYMPDDLLEKWKNIPPELVDISEFLRPFCEFLQSKSKAGDICMIQGDFGASFYMINFAKNHALKTFYATTKRKCTEEKQGDTTKKTAIFEHVIFREYK
ncbi:MAG: hypothetical protein K5978_07010 [Campylobacter sp.]|nr:hypothetical protein [Campylobacter sp.]